MGVIFASLSRSRQGQVRYLGRDPKAFNIDQKKCCLTCSRNIWERSLVWTKCPQLRNGVGSIMAVGGHLKERTAPQKQNWVRWPRVVCEPLTSGLWTASWGSLGREPHCLAAWPWHIRLVGTSKMQWRPASICLVFVQPVYTPVHLLWMTSSMESKAWSRNKKGHFSSQGELFCRAGALLWKYGKQEKMTQVLISYLHIFAEHWVSAGDNNNDIKIMTICAITCATVLDHVEYLPWLVYLLQQSYEIGTVFRLYNWKKNSGLEKPSN